MEIEKNVPLPPRRRCVSDPARAGMTKAIRALGIGESVFIPGYSRTLAASTRSVARFVGIRAATRKAEKDGVIGVRVWRLE
jgi:hypothetical protein